MEETNDLMGVLMGSNDTKDLTTYLDSLDDKYPDSLSTYIKTILKRKKISASELIKKSRIERTYCYQILNGRKKPGRDKIVAMALALDLSLEETQRMLTIAKEGVLYPKSRRDSILIFALNSHYTLIDTNQLLAEYNEEELR